MATTTRLVSRTLFRLNGTPAISNPLKRQLPASRVTFSVEGPLPPRLPPLSTQHRNASSAASPKVAATVIEEEPTEQPLRTYNVTKADARPVLSEHHKISWDEKKVLVPWQEGKTSNFHNIWLRDHCQCSVCRHPETKQRLLDTFSIPFNIQAAEVEAQESGLKIIWRNDKHESFYPYEWLHLHSYNPRLQKYLSPQYAKHCRQYSLPLYTKQIILRFKLWSSDIGIKPPEVSYSEVMESDKGVAKWTSKIYTYGFCYVDGVPVSLDATQRLVERISYVRPTHYGGFWDFTSDLTRKDTAYTDLPLEVHTDTTYFTDSAGLQLFHLLEHKGDGGTTVLVDGFKAARILRDEHPDSYRILSNVRIPSHTSGNEGISIQPFAPFPVLNHHPVDGELVQIRWNNDDRATMDSWGDSEEVDRFYESTRHWVEILRRRDVEYREQLVPGRALIFDNWRVLHGRTGFTGLRRMCGAYVNRDDYISRFLMTNTRREAVLNAI